ncbi:Nhlrc2, partial [Symbiodinium necroappetens]
MRTTSMDIGKAFSLRSYSDTRLRDYNVTQSQSSFSKMPGLTQSWAVLDVAEKEPMVKALRRSSIKLGFAKPNFNSTSRIDFRPFTQAEQGASQGAMDPAAKADLRAVHYRLGEDGPSRVNYVWYESELDRCARSHWDPTRKVQAWQLPPESPMTRSKRVRGGAVSIGHFGRESSSAAAQPRSLFTTCRLSVELPNTKCNMSSEKWYGPEMSVQGERSADQRRRELGPDDIFNRMFVWSLPDMQWVAVVEQASSGLGKVVLLVGDFVHGVFRMYLGIVHFVAQGNAAFQQLAYSICLVCPFQESPRVEPRSRGRYTVSGLKEGAAALDQDLGNEVAADAVNVDSRVPGLYEFVDSANCSHLGPWHFQVPVLAGQLGFYGTLGDNVPGPLARFRLPRALALDELGQRLFVSDAANHAVRTVSLLEGNHISTVAGQLGVSGRSGDGGPALMATLLEPAGLALSQTHLFVSDQGNHAVRVVDLISGIITTVAGMPGSRGDAGDQGLATSARLDSPAGLAHGSNLLYIADSGNGRVRVLDTGSGMLTTVPGARSLRPQGLALDEVRQILYFSDVEDHAVYTVDLLNASAVAEVVVGIPGMPGDFGDTPYKRPALQ